MCVCHIQYDMTLQIITGKNTCSLISHCAEKTFENYLIHSCIYSNRGFTATFQQDRDQFIITVSSSHFTECNVYVSGCRQNKNPRMALVCSIYFSTADLNPQCSTLAYAGGHCFT